MLKKISLNSQLFENSCQRPLRTKISALNQLKTDARVLYRQISALKTDARVLS